MDRSEQLLHAVEVLTQFSIVAVDAEFTQNRSHTRGSSSVPRLALLQLAVDQQCFIVDALRLSDLSPLQEVVAHPDITVLLHGAGADLRVMAERELFVTQYYDLEAACRSVFGQHESSLATMLQRAFNMRLDKSLQRTDWTRRPLPPAMIAYAARDAEVTLALYYWLHEHFYDILQLHKNTEEHIPVAAWIEPFLRGASTLSPEMAVADALTKGVLRNKAQVYADCRAALASLKHPMLRSRLLRLIADLSLVKLAPDLVPLLSAPTADERASCIRALGRLGVKTMRDAIRPLLHDPVYDVRKAAWVALRNLQDGNEQRRQRLATTTAADGTRSWVIESSNESAGDTQSNWKSRLRSSMDS